MHYTAEPEENSRREQQKKLVEEGSGRSRYGSRYGSRPVTCFEVIDRSL